VTLGWVPGKDAYGSAERHGRGAESQGPPRTTENAMISGLDHLVLTMRDLDATVRFYVEGLGMELREFDQGRKALHFGSQKINLHLAGREFEPKAALATPGSADLCFLTERPLAEIGKHLETLGFPIIEGPVPRTGATGPMLSIYTRDPDGNLIEIARLQEQA
jgi:catechol 2,3-dioxygenase-like lactoylglutathione lyase family enzyme